MSLDDAGVDLLEISGGNYENPAMLGSFDLMASSTRIREAYFLEFANGFLGRLGPTVQGLLHVVTRADARIDTTTSQQRAEVMKKTPIMVTGLNPG